ncbi:MAG: hypothetical protein R3E39_26515 [Anaerolineae bacterium]
MKILCNGQSGLNKRLFLEKVKLLAEKNGKTIELLSVSDLMHAHDVTIRRDRRVLDDEPGKLREIRRAAFRQAIDISNNYSNVLLETLLTTRWRRGLDFAFEVEQIYDFEPDMYITLIDNVDTIKHEMVQDQDTPFISLKDIMVWREEEIRIAQLLAKSQELIHKKAIPHYVIAVEHKPEVIYDLIFEQAKKKVYPSFPITAIRDQPELQKKTREFRDFLGEHFVVFDAETISEKRLHYKLLDTLKQTYPTEYIELDKAGRQQRISIYEILDIIHDIDGQIIARDFSLIDQADMVIALILANPSGGRVPSSGTDQEVAYAHQNGKEVYVVEMADPGPFFKNLVTKSFPTFDSLKLHLKEKGYVP